MERYTVWQWGIEILLGSHSQTKLSSKMIARGFDSKQEAQDWANSQDQSEWGNWDFCQHGPRLIWTGEWSNHPKSYRQAIAEGALPG